MINQAVSLSEVGDRTGALAAIDEAVSCYRALVGINPAVFTPDLAHVVEQPGDLPR